MYTTLISAGQLQQQATPAVLIDCRFDLANPEYGAAAWDLGHLPGAHFLHLDYHLSGPKNGQNGRHPLPDGQRLAVTLGSLGISPDTQVVCYDDLDGRYAARAWWLLRWLGHEAVAVLDGGLKAWQAAGGELDREPASKSTTRFSIRPPLVARVTADDIAANLCEPKYLLVDSRSSDRFAGQNETLDPVAGHIPGARNRFFGLNLQADGRFKPAAELRAEWLAVLDGEKASDAIIYCGSGVTACHNLLALEHAGLEGARLYAGSWSEWCSDPLRPVSTAV